MTPIEPVIFAALITAEPLLLIGPHGTGKSFLLNRISAVLGLESRHYNASLLNFDDLVGYPLPNGKGQIEYIQTPAAIWGAPAGAKDQLSCMDFPRATGDASSYNTGGFDATNSANRLSFRNVANSSSLYTLLKSL